MSLARSCSSIAIRRSRHAYRSKSTFSTVTTICSSSTNLTFFPPLHGARGSSETALVRLRRELDLPELTPAHRLDRLTAGVLVFTVRREARRAYQMLFETRTVEKEYEAVAPAAPHLRFPFDMHSRIVKERGVLQAREVPGEVNAVTRIDVHGVDGEHALYRLLPRTGKTHQLRVHMNSTGIPIVGDPLYPHVYDVARDDYSSPLQLLARAIEFDDPITGRWTRFTSRRNLAAWDHNTS